MAELRSQDKRDKLRLIWQAIQSAGQGGNPPTEASQITLQSALLSALQACDSAINGAVPGTFISSSNEAGGSIALQAIAGYSPIVARRLIGEMLDAYDHVLEWLKTNTTNGQQPTDEQIFNGMMKFAFRSIRKYRSDFTGGRYGIGYYFGTS